MLKQLALGCALLAPLPLMAVAFTGTTDDLSVTLNGGGPVNFFTDHETSVLVDQFDNLHGLRFSSYSSEYFIYKGTELQAVRVMDKEISLESNNVQGEMSVEWWAKGDDGHIYKLADASFAASDHQARDINFYDPPQLMIKGNLVVDDEWAIDGDGTMLKVISFAATSPTYDSFTTCLKLQVGTTTETYADIYLAEGLGVIEEVDTGSATTLKHARRLSVSLAGDDPAFSSTNSADFASHPLALQVGHGNTMIDRNGYGGQISRYNLNTWRTEQIMVLRSGTWSALPVFVFDNRDFEVDGSSGWGGSTQYLAMDDNATTGDGIYALADLQYDFTTLTGLQAEQYLVDTPNSNPPMFMAPGDDGFIQDASWNDNGKTKTIVSMSTTSHKFGVTGCIEINSTPDGGLTWTGVEYLLPGSMTVEEFDYQTGGTLNDVKADANMRRHIFHAATADMNSITPRSTDSHLLSDHAMVWPDSGTMSELELRDRTAGDFSSLYLEEYSFSNNVIDTVIIGSTPMSMNRLDQEAWLALMVDQNGPDYSVEYKFLDNATPPNLCTLAELRDDSFNGTLDSQDVPDGVSYPSVFITGTTPYIPGATHTSSSTTPSVIYGVTGLEELEWDNTSDFRQNQVFWQPGPGLVCIRESSYTDGTLTTLTDQNYSAVIGWESGGTYGDWSIYGRSITIGVSPLTEQIGLDVSVSGGQMVAQDDLSPQYPDETFQGLFPDNSHDFDFWIGTPQ